jgi:hypothetical protein
MRENAVVARVSGHGSQGITDGQQIQRRTAALHEGPGEVSIDGERLWQNTYVDEASKQRMN